MIIEDLNQNGWTLASQGDDADGTFSILCRRFEGARAHEHAADMWSIAAGFVGARAPAKIAKAIGDMEDGSVDLYEAVRRGTAAALAEHNRDDGGPCTPRGCEVRIVGGEPVAVVWQSWTHRISLRSEGSDWIVSIEREAILRSERVLSMLEEYFPGVSTAFPFDVRHAHHTGDRSQTPEVNIVSRRLA